VRLNRIGDEEAHSTAPKSESCDTRTRRVCEWGIVLIIAAAYLTHLTPGHVFVSDDFAAYVMHAANLAEGRPYTAIHFVPNPKALWLAPSNGYPPVYPLLLTPAYRIWGLNLRTLKAVTVLCFVGFLGIFAELIRPTFSPVLSFCTLLILGFNPVFWEQKDLLLSEFPYLMFSFGTLLAIQTVYKNLSAGEFRTPMVLVVSVLIYLSYGTRTIGIALLLALALGDLLKFGKPSRFLIGVMVLTAVFIAAQTLYLASPKGYLSAAKLSPQMVASNAVFYGKTLSYAWQNGVSKALQIGFALAFTALAAVSFIRGAWKNRSAQHFYLLLYILVLIFWSAQIGMRGLLPIVPLYFVFGLEESGRIVNHLGGAIARVCVIFALLFVALTYAGEMRRSSQAPLEPNVLDPSAQEMFRFLRVNTRPEEVLVFPKPRTLALYTNRSVTSLAPNEEPGDAYEFMKAVRAPILVKPNWSPPSWQALLDSHLGQPVRVFQNSEYQVFRMKVNGNFQSASGPPDNRRTNMAPKKTVAGGD